MQILSVNGGRPLCGTVSISGAKNSVLPILAAVLVCGGPCVLHNCPQIEDVHIALQILQELGCKVQQNGESLYLDADGVNGWEVPAKYAGKMRASVIFLGAILTRMKRVRIAMPGGCPLGKRPIDLHIRALGEMGARFCLYEQGLECCAEAMHSAVICLPFPSVGATENAILAALGAEGCVRIENAAREPEITDLIRFLRACGAQITGEGTSSLIIEGGLPLQGTEYTIMPDRIETATYLCATAACQGDVRLRNTCAEHLLPVLAHLEQSGCVLTCERDSIRIICDGRLRAPNRVITQPYPGFPTDAQALLMAAVLRAEGKTVFEETIFENRFCHAQELAKLGADICLAGIEAQVCGVKELYGAQMHATDLRGGAALVIASLSAQGVSLISGVHHIHRGYEGFEEKLKNLGACIECVEIPQKIVYNVS